LPTPGNWVIIGGRVAAPIVPPVEGARRLVCCAAPGRPTTAADAIEARQNNLIPGGDRMALLHLSGIEEAEASGEIADLYGEIQRAMGIPFVPEADKILANAPNALRGTWAAIDQIFLQSSLPASLASMILFSVSSANNCQYCAPMFKATCMSAGIDGDTLAALDRDLDGLSPMRVQAIVKFAQKCARDRANLGEADYESVRAQGVSEQEILEIIALAALANFLNTVADSLKLQIDAPIAQMLQG
jgi:uncharacterized peroxidase-related enzyme